MKRKFYLRGLGIGILVTAVIMGIASGRNRQMTDEEIKARAKELGMVESTVLSNIVDNSPPGSAAPSQAPENTPAVSTSPENTPEVSVAPSDSPGPSVPPENDGKAPEGNTPMASSVPQNTPAASASPQRTPAASTPPVNTPAASAAPQRTPAVSTPPVNTPAVSAAPQNSPKVSPTPKSSPEASTPSPSPSPENTPETSAGETVTITIRSGQSSVAVSKMLEEAGLVTSASAYDKFLCDNGYDKRLKTGTYQIPVGASEEEIARIITSKAN